MRMDGFTAFAASAIPSYQASTRERHDERLGLRPAVEYLERDGALPRNHIGVVEWRNLGQAFLFHQPVGLFLRIVLRTADPAHLCTELLDRPDLRVGNQVREADDGADGRARGHRGHRAAVIAR